jgi:hypothetical protein
VKSTIRRLVVTLTASVAVVGILPMAPASAGQSCPIGQHEDAQTPGFQCVPGWCPSGSLLDGVTGTCVAPPGVPPPPLS